MSLSFYLLYEITIDLFSLGLDEIVGNGFFSFDIFGNNQSELIGAPSEKSGINDRRNVMCFSVGSIRDKGMNLLLNPLAGVGVFVSQFR